MCANLGAGKEGARPALSLAHRNRYGTLRAQGTFCCVDYSYGFCAALDTSAPKSVQLLTLPAVCAQSAVAVETCSGFITRFIQRWPNSDFPAALRRVVAVVPFCP